MLVGICFYPIFLAEFCRCLTDRPVSGGQRGAGRAYHSLSPVTDKYLLLTARPHASYRPLEQREILNLVHVSDYVKLKMYLRKGVWRIQYLEEKVLDWLLTQGYS